MQSSASVPAEATTSRHLKAAGKLRLAAAQRLVEASARGDRKAGERFLNDAGAFGIDTRGLWASPDPGHPDRARHAYLGVPGAGRTLTIFVSPLHRESDAPELAALIDEATRVEGQGRLSQVLLEPGDALIRSAFIQAGFREIAELAYLNRPRPGPEFDGEVEWGQGVVVRRWRLGDDEVVAQTLERTYEGTLDCPDLCGMRDPMDVVASHRATGVFDPNLWWLIEADGRCEGVMLFNPCPAQSMVELVYLGLSPALRGRGLARRLMRFALSKLADRNEREVSCAVDLRNTPAMRLYASLGFKETSRRRALVRV